MAFLSRHLNISRISIPNIFFNSSNTDMGIWLLDISLQATANFTRRMRLDLRGCFLLSQHIFSWPWKPWLIFEHNATGGKEER